MVSNQCFKQGIEGLSSVFPSVMPKGDNKAFVLSLWKAALDKVCDSDEAFMAAIAGFIAETEKLYPTDNWLAMVLNRLKPKVQESVGDIAELIFDVITSVSFLYPSEATKQKLEWLKEKSPIAYAVGNRMGWREMAMSENWDVVRGQIKAMAIEEVKRANETGVVATSAKQVIGESAEPPKKLESLISRISDKKLLGVDKYTND